MAKMTNKFKYDVSFQWEILKYTLKDKHGYKALLLYKFDYFDLVHQQVIARAIQRFFKRKKRVPASATVLNEELNSIFRTKDYAQSLLEDDRRKIKSRVRKLYKSVVKEGDEILHKCKLFASYIEFKKTLEDVDLENFQGYEGYSKKIQKAIRLGMEVDEKKGSFVVAGHRARIIERHNGKSIVPTPYRQLNRLTNAGGWEKGSIVVFMDKPKEGKTMTLVNIAVALIKRKGNTLKSEGIYKGQQMSAKRVAYFDMENGETGITSRIDQTVVRRTKEELLSGGYDEKLKKLYRQFRRFGGEIFVKRMPKGSTTDDLQRELDEIYTEYGIKFEDVIVDYAALMGATSGIKDDTQRISDVYLDLKNFALQNDLDCLYTANHVVRGAYKKRLTKYDPEDMAKCIDIERHVDAIIGLQQSVLDKQSNVLRMEMLEQRDGRPSGRVLFWVDVKTQTMREFKIEEEKAYNEQLEAMGEEAEGEVISTEERGKRQRKAKSDL
jgi:hypothetical protein